MTLTLRRLLIALAAITSVFTAASAQAQSCSVSSVTLGSTSVPVLTNGTFTAAATVTYNCSSLLPVLGVRICHYVTANAPNANSTYSYYVTKDTDSRLAFEVRDSFNRRLAQTNGSSRSTGGIRLDNTSGGTPVPGTSFTGSQTLTLTYLPLAQQDRVRDSSTTTYSTTFTLVSEYKMPVGTDTCENGLTSPSRTTSSITVLATVPKSCIFENFQDIDFGSQGSVTVAAGSNIRAFGNIGVRCTYQTPYTISIDNGLNGASGVRRMRSGSDYLSYSLFQPGCTVPWTLTSTLTGTGNTVNLLNNHQVCAQLATPLAIAPAAGTYSDTVVVTATF